MGEKLLGCGALKFLENGHGEFKSIRVHDNFRIKTMVLMLSVT
jgi:putative acetyltransferase